MADENAQDIIATVIADHGNCVQPKWRWKIPLEREAARKQYESLESELTRLRALAEAVEEYREEWTNQVRGYAMKRELRAAMFAALDAVKGGRGDG